jgi:hypothetical protein
MDMRDFIMLAEGFTDTLEPNTDRVLREEAPARQPMVHWIDDGVFEARWDEATRDDLTGLARAIFEAEDCPVYALNGMMFPSKRQALRAITSLARN